MKSHSSSRWSFQGLGGALALVVAASSACGSSGGQNQVPEKCEIAMGDPAPDFLKRVGCTADFLALSSEPLDATIPGARSGKVVLDTYDGGKLYDQLYFQNSVKYQIHYQFASKFLSGPDHMIVPPLGEFNRTQYYSAERRFILAAITHYEGPDIWALEFAPYDTASAAMIEKLYNLVKAATYFGSKLVFHPTSDAVEVEAKKLPKSIPIKTTNDIFSETDYQPLKLGSTVGKLRFVKADQLESAYVGFREVVVLDRVPNDIAVVAGMITEEFQTPLSHVNVLAQNRGTPNMGLRNATTNAKLKALEGKWVKLTVAASNWDIKEATQADADAWWEANKPKPIEVPALDLTQTELKDVETMVDESALPATKVGLLDEIKKSIKAYGTKATNYGVLKNTQSVPIRPAFGIPVYYYVQFMEENGFFKKVDALLADSQFVNDPAVRDAKLAELRDAIQVAPVNMAFQNLLRTKLTAKFPGQKMRFRTSTNAEDLDGFPCAGCYDSHTGDPANWEGIDEGCRTKNNKNCGLLQAIKKTWSGVWFFRTFEERSYHSIDHRKVGMALLVHHNFPDEEANGVAVTANIFDSSGLEPAFYINVQTGGDAEVVAPPPGVTSDQILYFYSYEGKPVTYLAHSNLLPSGQTVLTPAQIAQLGTALDAIHKRFAPAYMPASGFYGMDVEFKYDDEDNPGMPATLWIKQARPYHGRSDM